jgi:hypothetical protein
MKTREKKTADVIMSREESPSRVARPSELDDDALLKRIEVLAWLRKSPRWMTARVSSGEIKTTPVGGEKMFRVADVRAYLNRADEQRAAAKETAEEKVAEILRDRARAKRGGRRS